MPPKSTSTPPPTDGAYLRRIGVARRAKDALFARSANSPIPRSRRSEFDGLAYFPTSTSYRIEGLRLEPVTGADAEPFAMDTSDHRPREARRLGRFRFELRGSPLALTAYGVGAGRSASLFVPFRDETSGRETYASGRYLDLEPRYDGTFVLDFNEAYHPYCAYSGVYSCPLPPVENHLAVAIEAGERLGPIYRSGEAA